jgi:hypothetical protein
MLNVHKNHSISPTEAISAQDPITSLQHLIWHTLKSPTNEERTGDAANFRARTKPPRFSQNTGSGDVVPARLM